MQIIKNHKKEINRIEFSINDQKKDIIDGENKIKKSENENSQKVSFIKVDLPLPETPVIHIKLLRGKDTSRFLRLLVFK